MRRSMLALALLPILAAATHADAAAPKVVTVFTDATGDAGANGTAVGPAGNAGVDLASATITRKGNNLAYTISLASALPNFAQLPEGTRILWQFQVGKADTYRFTVKSFDIGKPDPIQQDGKDRVGKVYDKGEFRLEKCGESVPAPAGPLTFSACSVVAQLTGKVDAASKTLSWSMPLSLIKGKAGTVVVNGVGTLNGTGCNICILSHYAERSLSPQTVIDDGVASGNGKYTVPKA